MPEPTPVPATLRDAYLLPATVAAELPRSERDLTDAELEAVERRAVGGYPTPGYAERSDREIRMVREIRRWRAFGAARLMAALAGEPTRDVPRLEIVTDPLRCGGRPTVAGTRLPLSLLLEAVRADRQPAALAADYPRVPAESWPVLAALADELAGEEHPAPSRLERLEREFGAAQVAYYRAADAQAQALIRYRGHNPAQDLPECAAYTEAATRLWRVADELRAAALAGAQQESASPEPEFDEDAATMACGHPGCSYSSVWRRCMECPAGMDTGEASNPAKEG